MTGPALNVAVARKKQDFTVAFKDKLGFTTSAVDLDVFVEPALKGIAAEPEVDSTTDKKANGSIAVANPTLALVLAPASAPALSPALAPAAAAENGPRSPGSPGSPEPPVFDASGQRFEVRRRAIRVKVGEKPLIVRARFELDSEVLGQLLPGTTVTVIEERLSSGYVRACVNLDETDKKVADPNGTSGVTYRNGFDTTFRVVATEYDEMGKVASPTLGNRSRPRLKRAPTDAAPEATPQAAPTGERACQSASCHALSVACDSSRSQTATGLTAAGSPDKKLRVGANKRKPGLKLRLEEVVNPTAAAPAPAAVVASQPQQSQRPSQRDSKLSHRPGSQRSHRASEAPRSPTKSQRATVRTAQQKAKVRTGWVTLVKNGNKLVSSRLRLDVSTRQQHSQQWARRLENEKHMVVRKDGAKQPRSQTGPTLARPLAMELAGDGTGFAYGGLFPGTLHAHGALREFHTASYSIGVAGSYLLHVRLRNQAVALPGSPFLLQVTPGAAFAQSSSLPYESLLSEVGQTCTHLMATADKIGNACVAGGAVVNNTCDERSDVATHLQVDCEDQEDGTYLLKWTSQRPGEFGVSVKVAGHHVINSPTKIKFISTVPEIENSEITGKGLTQAVVGEQSSIQIQLKDKFGNEAVPGPAFRAAFRIALSFVKSSMTGQQGADELHDDVELTWSSDRNGDCEIKYRPHKDNQGFSELHLFCYLPGIEERQSLPGSPYQLAVSSNVNEDVSNETDTTGAAPRDYRIIRSVFDEAQERFGQCTVDAFASEPTTLLSRFWTANYCENAEGTDAMKQKWSRGERIWAHPPPELLPPLATLLRDPRRLADVLVCAPFWPSTPWFRDIASLAVDKKKYPAGSLRKVMKEDAPKRCESWPVIVFLIPAPPHHPDEDDSPPTKASPMPLPLPAAPPPDVASILDVSAERLPPLLMIPESESE